MTEGTKSGIATGGLKNALGIYLENWMDSNKSGIKMTSHITCKLRNNVLTKMVSRSATVSCGTRVVVCVLFTGKTGPSKSLNDDVFTLFLDYVRKII